MTDDAFDELLDRVDRLDDDAVDRAALDGGEVDDEVIVSRRRQFVHAVDRAVKKVVTRRDGRVWYTHSLRSHGCRLHFVRSEGRIHLIACLPLDGGDEDDST